MKRVIEKIMLILGGFSIGVATIILIVCKPIIERQRKTKELADKHLALYMLMNEWVKVKQENKSIADYFESCGYKRIAIYGMNYVGETLLSELRYTNVQVVIGIDNNASDLYTDINVVTPDKFAEEVDAIIVTPVFYYDEIVEALEKKTSCPIISIKNVIEVL